MKIILGRKKSVALLEEGRKENAMAMIVKKINDPALKDFLLDTTLNNLIAADPTSGKKYIEWAARRMSEIARKEEDDNYLRAMSDATNMPDGMFPGGPGDKAYTPERLKMIQSYTPEQRVQGGYLSNSEKYYRSLDDAKVNIENRANVIVRSLRKYHRLAERNLINKNIDTYKEIYEWEHDVYKAEKDEQEREEMKKREKGAKESTDYLHDDDDYMIVRPLSEDSSCYYGRGTKWCISATQSRNYFAQYTGEGTGFYFVLFKHLPQQDPYKKLALVFTASSESPEEVFDAADDEVGTDAITEAAIHNVLAAGLKEAAADHLKSVKGEARVSMFKSLFDNLIEEYNDFSQSMDIDGEESAVNKDLLKSVVVALGLDEEDLINSNADLIEEHITELAQEQEGDIVGQANAHFEDNPAGPTDADFQALMEQHSYDYVYVSYEEYDENRMYWNGGFSLDITDIHEDLEDVDLDEAQDVIRRLLDDNHAYPDELDGYGNEISISFNPDYDENEGLNGFENFLNRMDDVDQALHKIMDSEKADTLVAFQEAGLIAGVTMKSLKQRFDDLELDNFEIDIEEKELSIYKDMQITVPMPDHLYRGLTDAAADWTAANRADIGKSQALQAFDAMIKKNNNEHSDELIQQIKSVFDQVFKLYVQKVQSALPGFERTPRTQEQYGLLVPEYNVGIYRTAHKTEVGPSGLILQYFLDVRIEADEEESLEENNLKLIELFLRKIDNDHMINKIRLRLETIVQNDVIKNIIPQFKEGGEEPEVDPMTGRVMSKIEREGEEQKKAQAAAEIDRLAFGGRSGEEAMARDGLLENKKKLRILIKESTPFGGLVPGMAGSFRANLGTTIVPHEPNVETGIGSDLEISAKAVLQRNKKVLLIKNHKGWDLPGGHIKEDETIVSGLTREVYEETGLTLSQEDISSLNMSHKNKKFFCSEFPTDDIQLSDEHYEYGFFSLEEVLEMEDIVDIYKKVIKKCLEGEDNIVGPKIKIRITGYGSNYS